MELLIILDALRRASAERITVVIPYYGYARQDKKVKPREPITARLIADLLTLAGASRILALDLHTEQLQGFFTIPVDHLYGGPLVADYLIAHQILGPTWWWSPPMKVAWSGRAPWRSSWTERGWRSSTSGARSRTAPRS